MRCKHCDDTIYQSRDLTPEIRATQTHLLDHVLFDHDHGPVCWNCCQRLDYQWIGLNLWGGNRYRINRPERTELDLGD